MKFLIIVVQLLSGAPLWIALAGAVLSARRVPYRPKTALSVLVACGLLIFSPVMLPPAVKALSGFLPHFPQENGDWLTLSSALQSFVYGLPYTTALVLLLWAALAPREPYP